MKKIVISGGGTAGHINPALSIAYHLDKLGWKVIFIGNRNSLEERLIVNADYSFYSINIQKIYRSIKFANLLFPVKLLSNIIRCCFLLKKIKPDAYLGTGGYVSGPGGIAAKITGIPVFLQEQNSYPGLTTRFLAHSAKLVFLGNKNAEIYLSKAELMVTGNPINPELINSDHSIKPKDLHLSSSKKKIFLLGGSQGSLTLNQNFAPIIEKILSMDMEIIWQTGKYSYENFHKQFASHSGIYIFDYTTDIASLYSMSHLVIARAGALTLAELETLKIPALLIPFPSASENHQFYNALKQKEKGIAEIIEQKDLTASLLLKKVISMVKKIDFYKNNFTDTPHRNAACQIAITINNALGGLDKCSEK